MKKILKDFFKNYKTPIEIVPDASGEKANAKKVGSQGFLFHGWIDEEQFNEFFAEFKEHPTIAIMNCSWIRKKGFMVRNLKPNKKSK